MRTLSETLLSAGDASGNLTSNALSIEQQYGFAIMTIIAGSTAGTIKLQGSLDVGTVGPNNPAAGSGIVNWGDIENSTQAVTGTGTATWNFQGAMYRWVRVVYTRSSGTGTITCIANTKGG